MSSLNPSNYSDDVEWDALRESLEEHVRKGDMYRIAPEDRLYVYAGREAKGREFADHFRQVWRAIAPEVRQAIVIFWRKTAHCGRPLIEYSNVWAPTSDDVYATTSVNLGKMQFVAKHFDPMPSDVVQFIIAHELAHVFQAARGDRPTHSPNKTDQKEKDADLIAMTWGFSLGARLSWDERQRDA